METKDGADAPKDASSPAEPEAKAIEAKVEAEKSGAEKPAADEPVKAADATDPVDPPKEPPAVDAAAAEKPVDAPVLAKVEPAGAPKPSSTGTIAGVVSLVILLGGVVGTILLARRTDATSGKRPAAEQTRKKKKGPKKDTTPWNVGDKVPVVITVLPEDTENLTCAAKEEIGGKHCAFQNKDTAWPKDDTKDDKILLRPYATVGQRRLIAAGFWSQITTMPEKRFTAKCTFEIEGKLDHPWVKFRKTMEFKEVKDTWYGGTLTNCSIVGAPAAGASGSPAAAQPAAASASAAHSAGAASPSPAHSAGPKK